MFSLKCSNNMILNILVDTDHYIYHRLVKNKWNAQGGYTKMLMGLRRKQYVIKKCPSAVRSWKSEYRDGEKSQWVRKQSTLPGLISSTYYTTICNSRTMGPEALYVLLWVLVTHSLGAQIKYQARYPYTLIFWKAECIRKNLPQVIQVLQQSFP